MKFEVGQVVILQSGGITMTVQNQEGDHNTKCVWMDSRGILQREIFLNAMLLPADEFPGLKHQKEINGLNQELELMQAKGLLENAKLHKSNITMPGNGHGRRFPKGRR